MKKLLSIVAIFAFIFSLSATDLYAGDGCCPGTAKVKNVKSAAKTGDACTIGGSCGMKNKQAGVMGDHCAACKAEGKQCKTCKANHAQQCASCDHKGAKCESCEYKNTSASMVNPNEGNVFVLNDGTKYFMCPVMKGIDKVENATAASTINGVTYYHCCPPCQGPFRAKSAKYLSEFGVPANVYSANSNGEILFRDPVNGKEGSLAEDTRYADHNGKRYFFTSKKTHKKFVSDPGSYVLKTSA